MIVYAITAVRAAGNGPFFQWNSVPSSHIRCLIEVRVRQGDHDVPKRDVLRRFTRGWENFLTIYQPMAESWAVYDNSGALPQLLERKK